MEKNYGLKLEDFQAKTPVYESCVDIEVIQAKFLNIMGYLKAPRMVDSISKA